MSFCCVTNHYWQGSSWKLYCQFIAASLRLQVWVSINASKKIKLHHEKMSSFKHNFLNSCKMVTAFVYYYQSQITALDSKSPGLNYQFPSLFNLSNCPFTCQFKGSCFMRVLWQIHALCKKYLPPKEIYAWVHPKLTAVLWISSWWCH